MEMSTVLSFLPFLLKEMSCIYALFVVGSFSQLLYMHMPYLKCTVSL